MVTHFSVLWFNVWQRTCCLKKTPFGGTWQFPSQVCPESAKYLPKDSSKRGITVIVLWVAACWSAGFLLTCSYLHKQATDSYQFKHVSSSQPQSCLPHSPLPHPPPSLPPNPPWLHLIRGARHNCCRVLISASCAALLGGVGCSPVGT